MLYRFRSQAGVALPVMLIMLVVMMISGIYLLRSSTSTTMSTSNLAYESALSKAADRGINDAFIWLTSTKDRGSLAADIPARGYVASMAVGPAQGVSNPAFWAGSAKLNDTAGNTIEYVIHRLCPQKGPSGTSNKCATSAPLKDAKAPTRLGDSVIVPTARLRDGPSLHYVITARIFGARGGNVVNQAEVMMGE